jgi:hypothetical protein
VLVARRKPLGAYEDTSLFNDYSELIHSAPFTHVHDSINNTLLDVTKDFGLNINRIVTNAIKRKSDTPFELVN